jgi:molecular chaperone GrpE
MLENEQDPELNITNLDPELSPEPIEEEDSGPVFVELSVEEKLSNLQEVVSSCQGVIADLREEKHDLSSQIQRTKADFVNFQKRARKDRQLAQLETTRKFLEKLIPILDNLGFALLALKDAGAAIKDPILMIEDAFVKVLESHDVSQIVPQIGEPFNPELHQAISVIPGDVEGELVAHIARYGYAIGDQIFRPADVVVQKKM